MIVLDSNLLLYAFHEESTENRAAVDWLDRALSEGPRVGIPWSSILTFVRLASNPRVFQNAVAVSEAWRQVGAWLDEPSTWVPTPTARHRAVLAPLIPHCRSNGDLIQDAHLAALAIEHGLTLCSTDGDFARFPGLRYTNPLRPER